MPNENTIQPITDDQELAKVLDGMNQAPTPQAGGLNFEETPQTAQPADPAAMPMPPGSDQSEQQPQPETAEAAPAEPQATDQPAEDADTQTPQPTEPSSAPEAAQSAPAHAQQSPSASPELDSIKKSALEELRPLVDKLNLPSDEKFDTLLLIIRSTDDQGLVSQAYDAAKSIEDESKRAEALLDIIKEIDYFANPQQNPQP